jgi:NAD(P)-dependent dehydrogenase (short-subunit alcohol dehydrogenase family)
MTSALPAPGTNGDRAPKRTAALARSVAVVTGGGRGIGRLLACALADAGAAVGLVARSADELEETAELVASAGGVAAAAPADVSDPRGVARAFDALCERLGPIDVLVNNAGVGGPVGPAWEVDGDDWWRTCEINLRGVLVCAQLALPQMVARRRGRIVNVTSVAAVHRWPMVSAYAVSKAAVVNLTENLAAELRDHGVSVFSVHPGLVPIGLTEAALSEPAPTSAQERVSAWLRRELAEGRGADPGAAAALVTRLASGDADGLSGRHLSVHDDLDTLLASIEDIRAHDLYMLRLREPARATAGRPSEKTHAGGIPRGDRTRRSR